MPYNQTTKKHPEKHDKLPATMRENPPISFMIELIICQAKEETQSTILLKRTSNSEPLH